MPDKLQSSQGDLKTHPMIIKYPFWQYTKENPNAFYACINKDEAYCPQEIAERSICIDGDIGEVLRKILKKMAQ